MDREPLWEALSEEDHSLIVYALSLVGLHQAVDLETLEHAFKLSDTLAYRRLGVTCDPV